MDFIANTHSLKCPKCDHGMEEVSYEGVTIDRCTNCKGLWFDTDEDLRLKSLKGSESLDVGDARDGHKWDSRAEINCPRCGKIMDKSADPKQKHIWFEVCPEHGTFMDAKEFTDLKFVSPLDCIRSLIKGDRGTVAP